MSQEIDPRMIAGMAPRQMPAQGQGFAAPRAFVPLPGLQQRGQQAQQQRGPQEIDPQMIASIDEAPGGFESFGRGVAQGASLGFADEIAGAFEATFTGKSFEQARDESREAFARAQKANPGAFLAGEIGGGISTALIPGLGAAKGATLAAKIGRAAAAGALEGGIAGAGFSEAEDGLELAGDVARGAALGGAGGAALAGVGGVALPRVARGLKKLAEKSPERVQKRIVNSIVESTNTKPRNNLVGKSGERTQQVGKFILERDDLLATHRDPQAFLETVRKNIDEVGKKLNPIYAQADELSEGMELSDVQQAFDKVIEGLEKGDSPRIANAIRRRRDDIINTRMGSVEVDADDIEGAISGALEEIGARERKLTTKAVKFHMDQLKEAAKEFSKFKDTATVDDIERMAKAIVKASKKDTPVPVLETLDDAVQNVKARLASKKKIPATEARRIAGRLRRDGFEGVDITNVNEMKRAAQDVAMEMRERLNSFVEDVAKRRGDKQMKLSDVRGLNREMSMLSRLEEVAEPAAKRDSGAATKVRIFSEKNAKDAMEPSVGKLASAALDPTGVIQAAVGGQAAVAGARKGLGAADTALARAVSRGADVGGLAGRASKALGTAGGTTSRGVLPAAADAITSPDPGVRKIAQMARLGMPPREILTRAAQLGVPLSRARQLIAEARARAQTRQAPPAIQPS